MDNDSHHKFEWIGTEKEIAGKLAEGSKLVETENGPIEYATAGEGPLLLGVHGGMGGYDQGLVLSRPFIENGFSVLCPSRPGYLRTPASMGKTFKEQADCMALLLDKLGIEKVGLVTASAGGPPTYEFAMRHPDRTMALVVADGISCNYPMPEKAGKMAQALYMSDPGQWFEELMVENFPKPVIKEIINTEGYLSKKELKERVAHVMEDTGKLEFATDLFRTMSPYSLRKAGTEIDLEEGAKIDKLPLQKIKAPAFIVHGRKDADVKFSDGEYAASTIPDADHFWIEGGTHFCFWLSDKAAEAQQAAIDFLNKNL